MNEYAPASALGWLDLDTAASERVATLLRTLEEPGTLDVLGLGTIRDAFANMLTPGTSTVHTRLRYFIFLPWIFQRLADQRVSAADFASRLRDAEARLIDCLRKDGTNEGVIGVQAGLSLKRMPSDIYWASLADWGIRRHKLTLAEYGQRAARRTRRRTERDDDGNATEAPAPMWAAIPPPPKDFLESSITFELTPEEAQVLTDGIRQKRPDTLIAVLSSKPALSLDGIDYPWLVPGLELPSRLTEVLHHARCFSELTLGPLLVYNLLLAQEASQQLKWPTEELQEQQRCRLEDWRSLVDRRHKDLSSWVDQHQEFREVLADGITRRTLNFWNQLARDAVNDAAGFAENRAVHKLIRERERHLKSKRARLSYRSALENWNQKPVGGQLDYRWGITKIYLKDLAAAGPED